MTLRYEVKLDSFEGPLDLLLHLINKYEIDIYDIPVAQITAQYMEYIHAMQELELNIASEYLVIAATLLEIKSKMLLPKQEVTLDDEYEEDPREELMNRLIEYRKFKDAATHLKGREMEQSQIWTRPPMQVDSDNDKVIHHQSADIYDIIGAIAKITERRKWTRPLETSVQKQEIPIEQRMDEVLEQVKTKRGGISFYQLFPVITRSYVVATFIAILELMKLHKVECYQAQHFEDIIVRLKD